MVFSTRKGKDLYALKTVIIFLCYSIQERLASLIYCYFQKEYLELWRKTEVIVINSFLIEMRGERYTPLISNCAENFTELVTAESESIEASFIY